MKRASLACAILLLILFVISGCSPKLRSIRISPSSCSMLVNEWNQFIAYGTFSDGKEIPLSWANWSYEYEDGVGVGILQNEAESVYFYPQNPGKVNLSVNLDNIWASASIAVGYTPICTYIDVDPESWEMSVNEAKAFTAIIRDQFGFPMDIEPCWDLSDGLNGTLSTSSGSSTTFTALGPGNGSLRVSHPTNSKYVPINVIYDPILTSIKVTPASINLNEGQIVNLSAIGYDQYNNVMQINPVWSVTSSAGSIEPSMGSTTKFTAVTLGSCDIIATQDSISGKATATIGYTPVLTSIIMSPTTSTLFVGEAQRFTAYGYDQKGAPMDIDPEPLFFVTGNIGTLQSGMTSSLFIAKNVGTGSIIAQQGDITGVAEIIVNAAPVATTIEITPSTWTLNSARLTLKAIVKDQYGNVILKNPTWSIVGSSIASVNASEDRDSYAIFQVNATVLEEECFIVQAKVDDAIGEANILVPISKLTEMRFIKGFSNIVLGDSVVVSAGTGGAALYASDQYQLPFPVSPSWSLNFDGISAGHFSGSFEPTIGQSTTFVTRRAGYGRFKAQQGEIVALSDVFFIAPLEGMIEKEFMGFGSNVTFTEAPLGSMLRSIEIFFDQTYRSEYLSIHMEMWHNGSLIRNQARIYYDVEGHLFCSASGLEWFSPDNPFTYLDPQWINPNSSYYVDKVGSIEYSSAKIVLTWYKLDL